MSGSKIVADSTMLDLRSLVLAALDARYALQENSDDHTARGILRKVAEALNRVRSEALASESLDDYYQMDLEQLGLTSNLLTSAAADDESVIERLWEINERLKGMLGDRLRESVDSQASRYAASAI